MTAAVARQEHQAHPGQGSEEQLVGGLSEGRLDALPACVLETFEVVDAAAAQHADDGRIAAHRAPLLAHGALL